MLSPRPCGQMHLLLYNFTQSFSLNGGYILGALAALLMIIFIIIFFIFVVIDIILFIISLILWIKRKIKTGIVFSSISLVLLLVLLFFYLVLIKDAIKIIDPVIKKFELKVDIKPKRIN
jgi:hypothetical protein